MIPALGDREFGEWNEEMVERYDIERYYRDSHPIVRWIERHRLARLRGCAAVRPQDRVLEVGCGAGHVLDAFADCDRTGLDISPAMLKRARSRLGGSVRLVRASAEDLPLLSGSFDVVLCTEVLEHTRSPELVVRELIRVAAPGARVVVSVPNERNIDRAKRIIRAVPGLRHMLRSLAEEGNEWHLHTFDAARLRAITRSVAEITELHAVPGPVLPIRFVAVLRALEVRNAS